MISQRFERRTYSYQKYILSIKLNNLYFKIIKNIFIKIVFYFNIIINIYEKKMIRTFKCLLYNI